MVSASACIAMPAGQHLSEPQALWPFGVRLQLVSDLSGCVPADVQRIQNQIDVGQAAGEVLAVADFGVGKDQTA